MGIDVHFGDHYFALFHVHRPALLLSAPVALYAAFKLGRFVLTAIGVLPGLR